MATAKLLGYGGSGEVDGIQTLITSGSFSESQSIAYLNMISVQPASASRSKVKYAEGTRLTNGNMAFDLTVNTMQLLTTSKLFQRGYTFNVGIHDGEERNKLSNCYLATLNLTGSTGGLLSASIDFVSGEQWSPTSVLNQFIRDQEPFGYWYSGDSSIAISDWSFSLTQELSPVYTNNYYRAQADSSYYVRPSYFHVGLWSMTFDVTTFENPPAETFNHISVATKTFTLTGDRSSAGYNFGGQGAMGTYTHSFESSAAFAAGAGGTIITIT